MAYAVAECRGSDDSEAASHIMKFCASRTYKSLSLCFSPAIQDGGTRSDVGRSITHRGSSEYLLDCFIISLGPILLGTMFTLLLHGILLVQCYNYYS